VDILGCIVKKIPVPSVTISDPQIEPLLVDIPTAARMLSTTVWAVRSLLWSKTIPYIPIGKKHLISPADIRAYIQKARA
jgi:hypothetical protein